MTIRIKCTTLFDITVTGVKNRFHRTRLPFADSTGFNIASDKDWQRSRNKQSNWETINQVISLRTLPENITNPLRIKNRWEFEFTVPDLSSIERNGDPVAALKDDCSNVPMITGLDEAVVDGQTLTPGINIWFDIINN